MSVKQIAGLIVAGLVAGVVLGSFGIAGASGPSPLITPATSAACATQSDCSECAAGAPQQTTAPANANLMDCQQSAGATTSGQAPAGCPDSGTCTDCE